MPATASVIDGMRCKLQAWEPQLCQCRHRRAKILLVCAALSTQVPIQLSRNFMVPAAATAAEADMAVGRIAHQGHGRPCRLLRSTADATRHARFKVWRRRRTVADGSRPPCHGLLCSQQQAASGAAASNMTKSVAASGRSDDAPPSMMQMLRFAGPALGIYLTDPIMTNIDNSFVGQFSGTDALAALGPGNVMSGNVLFLFGGVLNAATTGLVSRAWSKEDGANKAKAELSKVLTIVLFVGAVLTVGLCCACGPVIRAVGTAPQLVKLALPYVRIRALGASFVLTQGICLSAILATKDSMTPLRVFFLAACLNFTGDTLLCYWPFRSGVAGAALATLLSQILGCFLMLGALRRKGIAPRPLKIDGKDARAVLEYAGPLFLTRVAATLGYSVMSTAATALGAASGAAYQVVIGVFTVFAISCAPLSQIAQTTLPALIDAGKTQEVRQVGKNVLKLAAATSVVVAALCYCGLTFGATVFTKDPAVLAEIATIVPIIMFSCIMLMFGACVDGSLLAAKDFRFIVPAQVGVCVLQFLFLITCQNRRLPLTWVMASFPARLLSYLILAGTRVFLGYGPLGRVVRNRS